MALGRGRRQRLNRQDKIARTISPPTAQQIPITTPLCLSTQDLISPPTEVPSHFPLLQWPPPPHGVPSMKLFCSRIEQEFGPVVSEAQTTVQEESSHAHVSLLFNSLPIRDLHCWSRLVHWPLAQVKPDPLPQLVPSSLYSSEGQELELPVHFSSMSHSPRLARQTVSADEY